MRRALLRYGVLLGGSGDLVETPARRLASAVPHTTLPELAAFHPGFVLGVSGNCLHAAPASVDGLAPVVPSKPVTVDPGGHGTGELGHRVGVVRTRVAQ